MRKEKEDKGILSKGEIKVLLSRYNIRPRKSLGQNFLIDKNILKKIIGAGHFSKEDIVIEIGSGLGTLTEELAGEVKKVLAVEYDRKFCDALKERLSCLKNVKIVCKDFLKLKIGDLLDEDIKDIKVKFVGNLPYYITTPILSHLISMREYIDTILVMVQKEVAARILAQPAQKDYGSLSCYMQFYTKPGIIYNVPKSAFWPEPKVESSLILLDILETPPVSVRDEVLFFKIIRASFQERRKTILNSLSRGIANTDVHGKEKIKAILQNLSIDPMRRGETLSLEEFASIADLIERGKDGEVKI